MKEVDLKELRVCDICGILLDCAVIRAEQWNDNAKKQKFTCPVCKNYLGEYLT